LEILSQISTTTTTTQMNPATEADALNLATGFTALLNEMSETCAVDDHEGCTEVVLFPPFPFISKVKDIVGKQGISVGAQQVYYEDKGAFTGSVAASMVKSVGCEYVLCGHSERRTLFSDSDVNINAKVSEL
jgi:triosephosphate isomerase